MTKYFLSKIRCEFCIILSAQFRRIARRRGKKRAAVAVAHYILVIAYHLLCDGKAYIELGGNYFDRLNKQQLERGLVKR